MANNFSIISENVLQLPTDLNFNYSFVYIYHWANIMILQNNYWKALTCQKLVLISQILLTPHNNEEIRLSMEAGMCEWL